jgi:molybdopterin molybdotransferase
MSSQASPLHNYVRAFVMKQDWSDIAETLAGKCTSIFWTETVSLGGAIGRILAEPLVAAQSLPASTHAVMDGYALGSNPPGLYSLVASGSVLGVNEASEVVAGGPIPHATAAVILGRHAQLHDGKLNVSQQLTKNNIRRSGEEAKFGEEILPANTRLDIRHISLAAVAGVQTLTVQQRPRVALIGLHERGNSFPHAGILHALLDSPALQLTNAGVVRHTMLTTMIERLSTKHDLIVVVAESLADETGPLAASIASLGGKPKLFRAALKPAKPLVTGRVESALIIGLAGTAYATTAAAHLFLQPLLQKLLDMPKNADLLPVSAAFERSREPGRAEALPAKLSVEDQRLWVKPAGRFGQLRALAIMDGFAIVPESSGNITEGMPLLFKRLSFPLV